MGGDLGHHASQWRPNELINIPKELIPSPFGPDSKFNVRKNICPGEIFIEHAHPSHSNAEPFTRIRAGHPYNVEQSRDALKATEALDADDDILVIMAHDWTLLNVLDYFPKSANRWHEAGWKERSRWEFLKDFVKVVETNA